MCRLPTLPKSNSIFKAGNVNFANRFKDNGEFQIDFKVIEKVSTNLEVMKAHKVQYVKFLLNINRH